MTWRGGDPSDALDRELRDAGASPLVIGDLLRPRRVENATADAKEAVDAIVRAPAGATGSTV